MSTNNLISVMCERAAMRFMEEGRYALAYCEVIYGIRKGAILSSDFVSQITKELD